MLKLPYVSALSLINIMAVRRSISARISDKCSHRSGISLPSPRLRGEDNSIMLKLPYVSALSLINIMSVRRSISARISDKFSHRSGISLPSPRLRDEDNSIMLKLPYVSALSLINIMSVRRSISARISDKCSHRSGISLPSPRDCTVYYVVLDLARKSFTSSSRLKGYGDWSKVGGGCDTRYHRPDNGAIRHTAPFDIECIVDVSADTSCLTAITSFPVVGYGRGWQRLTLSQAR
ncbi:hypothetical protein J6590_078005 [Homalodisca vitripennis]|nr:hypothetical protein J6590_078005 [Homalodisca vitripennis]